MDAEITTLEKDVDRWSATHSVNSVRTRALMYRLLDAVKALAAAPPVGKADELEALCIPCVTATWCDLAGRCLAECSPGDDAAPLRAVYEPPAALKE
jgi:hypothetical protein